MEIMRTLIMLVLFVLVIVLYIYSAKKSKEAKELNKEISDLQRVLNTTRDNYHNTKGILSKVTNDYDRLKASFDLNFKVLTPEFNRIITSVSTSSTISKKSKLTLIRALVYFMSDDRVFDNMNITDLKIKATTPMECVHAIKHYQEVDDKDMTRDDIIAFANALLGLILYVPKTKNY